MVEWIPQKTLWALPRGFQAPGGGGEWREVSEIIIGILWVGFGPIAPPGHTPVSPGWPDSDFRAPESGKCENREAGATNFRGGRSRDFEKISIVNYIARSL